LATEHVPLAVERLERAGYRHEGDLGVSGREAFELPAGAPGHHLYVLPAGGEELRRYLLAFRDYPRARPEEARAYARQDRRPSHGAEHKASSANIPTGRSVPAR